MLRINYTRSDNILVKPNWLWFRCFSVKWLNTNSWLTFLDFIGKDFKINRSFFVKLQNYTKKLMGSEYFSKALCLFSINYKPDLVLRAYENQNHQVFKWTNTKCPHLCCTSCTSNLSYVTCVHKLPHAEQYKTYCAKTKAFMASKCTTMLVCAHLCTWCWLCRVINHCKKSVKMI